MFKPGDTAFLIKYSGLKKTFTAVVVYSVSKKRGLVRIHGSDAKFDMEGKQIGVPTWAPEVRIEPITPALMTEIRETANYQE